MSMFFGFSSLFTGIRLRKQIDNEWSMIIGGILSVIFGVLLLVSPYISALALIWTAGIFAIAGGIVMFVQSFNHFSKHDC